MAPRANENPGFYFSAFSTSLVNTANSDQYEQESVIETIATDIQQEPSFGRSAVQDITSNWISDPGSATETGEIKRSRDVAFWEDNSFGSTGHEEDSVPIPK
jgi:hypothetical protein